MTDMEIVCGGDQARTGEAGSTMCVERTMLDNDMFSVDGTTVIWKLRICGEKIGL